MASTLRPGRRGKKEPPRARSIVATYDYRDENGNLLYQVVRYAPKAFTQRRPDGNGGFVYHLDGVRRVVYRLPELLAADPAAAVYIVEGEKDVDTIVALGLVATTNAEGAGKWRADYNDHLRGRDVVLLPDQDDAGRKHAQQVAVSLRGSAASVRIIALPGLPPKGDVSDWLAAGGTREALEALVAAAPIWTPPSERLATPDGAEAREQQRFRFFDDVEIAALPPPEPLVGELLTVDALAVCFGAPDTAKSFLALDLSLSIATGSDCLGYAVRQGPVVYIAAEGASGLGIRVRAWKQAHGLPPDHSAGLLFLTEAVNLLSVDDIGALLAALAALPERPVLLVVDTFARCLIGGDENSARDVGLAIAALDRVRRTIGCTVLLVHHTGKQTDVERGSSALRAAADTMLAVTKDGDAVTLRCEKQKNAAPFKDIGLRLVPIDLGDGESSCVLELGEPKPEDLSGSKGKALRALIELFDEGGATVTDWQRNSRIPETTFRRARKALERAGYVSNPPEARGGLVTVTAAGRAAAERLAATGSGGKDCWPNQPSSSYRHSPPAPRHGGDRPSPPPSSPPYRGDGLAGDGVRGASPVPTAPDLEEGEA